MLMKYKLLNKKYIIHCRSGNVREAIIFVSFVKKINFQIEENYHYKKIIIIITLSIIEKDQCHSEL